jgi:hypothetical protein
MADHSGFDILSKLEGGTKKPSPKGKKKKADPTPSTPKQEVKNGWEHTATASYFWQDGKIVDTGKLYNKEAQRITAERLSPHNDFVWKPLWGNG